jgi:hypothetical protein
MNKADVKLAKRISAFFGRHTRAAATVASPGAPLETIQFRWNWNGALVCLFDALSSANRHPLRGKAL